jgi:hypothetical protein
MYWLYENVISNLRNNEGWLEEINYNIGVKQGFPLYPTLFDIYIDKLEYCLEYVGCTSLTLTGIFIILLLYVDDIFLMVRNPCNLGKKLWILKYFFASMCMIVNTEKMKVVIIKSKKTTYNTFVYENDILAIEWEKTTFDTLVTHVILYGCEVWGSSVSKEYWRNIEQI